MKSISDNKSNIEKLWVETRNFRRSLLDDKNHVNTQTIRKVLNRFSKFLDFYGDLVSKLIYVK